MSLRNEKSKCLVSINTTILVLAWVEQQSFLVTLFVANLNMEFLFKNWFQNTNLSIPIARFSASESPRAYINTPKNPHFSQVAG